MPWPVETLRKVNCISPVATASSAAALPLLGTWVAVIPLPIKNCSASTCCGVPEPGVE